MDTAPAPSPVRAFQRAAGRVPAYRVLLAEAEIDAGAIRTQADFERLPVLEKSSTFQRFGIEDLCVDGQLGQLGSVLTSSGHSGIFAYGLHDAATAPGMSAWIDGLLDRLFGVRSKKTLLINCLPMGVKVPTQACTLAETSVRADMVVGLVKAFGHHFAQLIVVGEAAFVKHLLELGVHSGVVWTAYRIHVILGEEPLAENARKYLGSILGHDVRKPADGMVVSSMGVAELGLNLFSEAPPAGHLVWLRRALHDNAALRQSVLGPAKWVPSLFTYDPDRIFVEFDATGRLVVTTLDPHVKVPLIRYATGDRGALLHLTAAMRPGLEAAGVSWDALATFPIVLISGRGDHALAGAVPVYPEAIKEGIYHDAVLAAQTTANFRLAGGPSHARVRIQLAPDLEPTPELAGRFASAIARYVDAPLRLTCESYRAFGGGMALDYERKFNYLQG